MATRHYASSYSGDGETFTRSYLSTTGFTPLTSYSRAYEGTFGGYTGQYLKDTSTVPHAFIKAYVGLVPYSAAYTKIWTGPTLTNFTKGWVSATVWASPINYMKSYDTHWFKTYTGT